VEGMTAGHERFYPIRKTWVSGNWSTERRWEERAGHTIQAGRAEGLGGWAWVTTSGRERTGGRAGGRQEASEGRRKFGGGDIGSEIDDIPLQAHSATQEDTWGGGDWKALLPHTNLHLPPLHACLLGWEVGGDLYPACTSRKGGRLGDLFLLPPCRKRRNKASRKKKKKNAGVKSSDNDGMKMATLTGVINVAWQQQ